MTDPSTYVRSEKERGTVMYPNSTPEDIEPPSYESAVAQVPTMSRSVSPVPQPVHGHSSSYQQLPPWTVSGQTPQQSAWIPSVSQTNRTCVNQITLFSKDDPIFGTYLIDPVMPSSETLPNASMFFRKHCCKEERNKRRAAREHNREAARAEGGFSSDGGRDESHTNDMNAAFRTRNSNINIELGVCVASSPYQSQGGKASAHVAVSTRQGNVSVNIIEIHQGRCIDLDVCTRSGNILVLLPPEFSGSLALRTGAPARILPGLAQHAHVIKKSDRETLMYLFDPSTAVQLQSVVDEDRCVVSTRSGRVVMGLSSIDMVDTAGLWSDGMSFSGLERG
ncbi:hypothetical protein A0H81_06429 [Grifola frondosa]|uniref:DUF7330 domain-containing protein n=1 Tax=Grifola frondosa TaxID=5627 RepID=A0A1C7MAD7_GRIFR|nr:hypothetical protein A0H81_06429 [Grifola frondosa]